MMKERMKDLQIIHKNDQPYGIRDKGGFLLFFPTVTKYPGQEQRYIEDIQACYQLAEKILKALIEDIMEENEKLSKDVKIRKSIGQL
jgi:hypothetical protein